LNHANPREHSSAAVRAQNFHCLSEIFIWNSLKRIPSKFLKDVHLRCIPPSGLFLRAQVQFRLDGWSNGDYIWRLSEGNIWRASGDLAPHDETIFDPHNLFLPARKMQIFEPHTLSARQELA